MLNKVNTSTVQEAVYKELYEAIVKGKIRPGKKLTLRQLAADLGVSVMPIREAIRRLEALGIVNIAPNKQISVNQLTLRNFSQIQDARILLECHVAKIACITRSEESIVILEDLNKKMLKPRDHFSLIEYNSQFHLLIYKEADLPIFFNIIESLWEKVSPYLFLTSQSEAYWEKRVFIDYHVGILEGMRQKKPAEVYKWLKKDLMEAAKILCNVFKNQ
ncbi:MAG: GntR family transcriptional regulator [Desulfobacula sp.]|nr:GntR family transcriptional regulator [Desulfobacula sp.]